MAVTAKFQADFNSFYTAVQKAQTHLNGLQEGANRAESGLQRMVNSFSGKKIIQDASLASEAVERIGGVSKLTESEQRKLSGTLSEAIAKFKAMGVEVPPQMMKIAEATGAIPPKLTLMDKAAGLAKSSFGQMFGAFAGANLATTLITKLSGQVQEFVDTGLKLSAVEQSFQRLSASVGQNSGAMLSSLQEASRGMVSNFDLMLSANKAMQLGLPVTAESMGELAKTATALGKSMGLDATTALNDLITALGRSSPLILDNLGLTVKVGEANDKYAQSLGKSSANLTEAEKKIAFYNAAMDAARVKTEQLGEQTKTLGDLLQTAWVSVGNVVSKGVSDINVGLGASLSSWEKFNKFLSDASAFGTAMAVKLAAAREEMDKASAATNTNTIAQEQNRIASERAARAAEESAKFRAKQAQEDAERWRAWTAEAEANARAFKSLQDQLFGRDLIERAEDYAEALGDISNLSRVTADAKKELNRVMGEAYTHLVKLGLGASEAANQYRMLRDLTMDFAAVNAKLAAMPDPFAAQNEQRRRAMMETSGEILKQQQEILIYNAAWEASANAAQTAMDETKTAVQSVPPVSGQATTTITNQFIGAFDKITQRARLTTAEIIAELEKLDDAYRKAGIFIPTGSAGETSRFWKNANPTGISMTAGGAGNSYTINVSANSPREGRAAGEAVIATLKAKGIRI